MVALRNARAENSTKKNDLGSKYVRLASSAEAADDAEKSPVYPGNGDHYHVF